MKIYIGTNKEDELIFLEWDKEENLKGKMFSLSGGSYREPMTETEGEQRAEEYLEDGEGWKMAVDSGNTRKGLDDWKEDVLNIDGWEQTLGDIEDFGEHNGETIYLQLSSCGQYKEEINNFKNLWINEEDLKKVYELWDKRHLKNLEEAYIKTIEKFFENYKIVCSEQEALNRYLEDINY